MKYVALLRGINVGGNRTIDMKQLKATFERAGVDEVRTYINSGNVIFRGDPDDAGHLAQTFERAIADEFGFDVRVLVRDENQMNALIEALPDDWANDDSAKCDVIFLSDAVDSPEVLGEFTIKPDIDDARYLPGAVMWRVERSNVTRSGLMRLVGTELYAQTTVRNCNTVRKLAALMR
jgi:uncharacterized protein (DUF1697 family)